MANFGAHMPELIEITFAHVMITFAWTRGGKQACPERLRMAYLH